MNLYQKLIEVRKSCPYLKKDNAGFQFKYVSSSQTLGSLREAMDAQGVLLCPEVLSYNVTEKATKKDGVQFFTELFMKFTWINAENPEERIECQWYGQGLDTGEKGVGKCVTYAEKYFLLKFFNIATDKDDPDSFQQKHTEKPMPNEQQDPPPQQQSNSATEAQRSLIHRLIKSSVFTEDERVKAIAFADNPATTKSKAGIFIDTLQKTIEVRKEKTPPVQQGIPE